MDNLAPYVQGVKVNRQHRSWRNARETYKQRCAQANEPCHLCGQPIDYTLSGRDPWGFTADHIEPIATGGRLLPGDQGLRPAHLRCNSARGDGTKRAGYASAKW
jgi:hypothetical protein